METLGVGVGEQSDYLYWNRGGGSDSESNQIDIENILLR